MTVSVTNISGHDLVVPLSDGSTVTVLAGASYGFPDAIGNGLLLQTSTWSPGGSATPVSLTVALQGQTGMVVRVSGATLYTTSGLSTPVTFPQTISTNTTWYASVYGIVPLTVSVKDGLGYEHFVAGTANLDPNSPATTVTAALPPLSGSAAAPTGVAATDTATVNAAKAAGTRLGAGTYVVNALTLNTNDVLVGVGRGVTILQLAASANADVIQSASFGSLTCTGSTGGVHDFAVRDLTIDGNKANNSSSWGLRVYGYRYQISTVEIKNCATQGLYTEWTAGSVPGSDAGMEARYTGLRIHDNALGGWQHRGPHDSHGEDVIIYQNGSNTGPGLQAQSPSSTSIASGSNAVNVNTFAGAGVLNVGSTVGYPTAGSLTVGTDNGNQTVTYTGISAKTFTGCTCAGSGVMSTAGAIGMVGGGYSGSGLGISGLHVWGPHTYSVDAANASILATNFQIEGGQTGNLWLRCGNGSFVGGRVFSANVAAAFGVRIGDSTSGYAALNNTFIGSVGQQDFAGTSSSTASIDFNSSTTSYVDAFVSAGSGTSHITGTPSASDVLRIIAYGQSATINAGNSMTQHVGSMLRDVGTVAESWQSAGADIVRVNGSTKLLEGANGAGIKLYSAAYAGQNTVNFDGLKGHIGFAVRNGQNMSTSAGAAAGTSPPAATLQSSASDVAGETNGGSGTATTTGAYQSVVFAQAYTATPIVIITAQNAATQALGGFVTSKSTNGFTISVAVAPTASQTVGTYIWDYVVIARGA